MKSSSLKIFFGLTTIFITILLFFSVSYISRLNDEIKHRFDGKRWSLPAIVYARPLDLYAGLKMSPEMFVQELELGGYRKLPQANNSGSYYRNENSFSLVTRGFYFPSGYEPSRHLSVEFMKDELTSISDTTNQQPVDFARIDPARIGSFHPIVHEDRIIINRQEIPEQLIQTLLAVEDRNFYSHLGVSPFSILRALAANFRAE